jgi:DNA invertase Pin-like site-specific DNA recombinase
MNPSRDSEPVGRGIGPTTPSERLWVRTPNFASDGPQRPAETPVGTAVNHHLLAPPASRTRVRNQRRTTSPSQGSATVPSMGHRLGYARVSTTDQQPQRQVDALEAAGCYRVFTETASGARTDRPTLTLVLDQLRPGDTLMVWKLDRLGRSLRHLVDTVTNLARAWRRVRQPAGGDRHHHPRRQAGVPRLRRLAEFEGDLVRERTAAGLAAARARGRQGGRPSVMTAHKVRVAWEMYASGEYTVTAITTTPGA